MTEAVRIVGRYQIMHRLGRGGMAVVHLARQTDLDRHVALKELNALEADDPSYARRFLQESRLAGSLAHPNIVHVYDYFEHDGTPFIAMEYLAGGTLRPHVGHMTFSQIAGVLEAVLSGLAHAEREGIVHRDLKPENILVAPDGHIKIADFGIAKAINRVNPSAMLTATGMAVGTPAYMAPEQAMAGQVGPWTDLYAIGCMAYEFFTSTVPFSVADNPMAMMMRRINEPNPRAGELNPALPPGLADWIDALLIKDPEARTRSAVDAYDALEDIVIDMAGARWRRSARLPMSVEADARVDPLALSEGVPRSSSRSAAAQPGGQLPGAHDDLTDRPDGASGSDERASVAGVLTPPPDDAAPGPYTPPPDDAIPDTIPGPYTPPPGNAIRDPDSTPAADPLEETTRALFRHDTDDGLPSTASPPPPSVDAGGGTTQGYDTYRPPPPSRPPSDDAPAAVPAPSPEDPRHSEDHAGSMPPSSPGRASSTVDGTLPLTGPTRNRRERRGRSRRRAAVLAGIVLGACALAGIIAFALPSGDKAGRTKQGVSPIPLASAPNAMAVVDNRLLWVSTRKGTVGVRPDGSLLRRAQATTVGGSTLSQLGRYLWVPIPDRDEVVQLNAQTGERLGAISTEARPRALALTPGSVYVSQSDGTNTWVQRYDARTRQANNHRIRVPQGARRLSIRDGTLWVLVQDPDDGPDRIARYDAETGDEQKSVPVDSGASAMAYSDGAFWVTNADSGTVTRVDAGTLERSRFSVGGGPANVRVGHDGVWVTNPPRERLQRLDPESEKVTDFKVGPRPYPLAITSDGVWVGDTSENNIRLVKP
jgi:serine/threonine protein kinase